MPTVDAKEVARIASVIERAVYQGKSNMLWRGKILDFRTVYPDPTEPLQVDLLRSELERLAT